MIVMLAVLLTALPFRVAVMVYVAPVVLVIVDLAASETVTTPFDMLMPVVVGLILQSIVPLYAVPYWSTTDAANAVDVAFGWPSAGTSIAV